VAYWLVKNKNHFSQGQQALLLLLFFGKMKFKKCRLHTYSDRPDAMDKDIKKALEMGFRSYITKPIDIPNFLRELDEALT